MDRTAWCLVFAVIGALDAIKGRASGLPPPENVTVDCDNFDTLVYWNYSGPQTDDLRFHLTLVPDMDPPRSTNVTTHHANITAWLDETGMSLYTITIQAWEHGTTRKSDPSSPVKFTFHKLTYLIEESNNVSLQLCQLDFPDVNFQYEYKALSLSFQNPVRLYENAPGLKYFKTIAHPKLKDTPLEYYIVDEDNRTTDCKCSYNNATCREKLPILNKEEKHCIRLYGHIDYATMRRATRCWKRQEDTGTPLHVVVVSVCVVIGMAAVVILISLACWRVIIKPNQNSPAPLFFPGNLNSDPIIFVNETEPNVNFSPVMWEEDPSPSSEYSERLASEPSENSQNALLSDYASDICEEPTDSSACSRFPIGPGHVHHDNDGEVGGTRRQESSAAIGLVTTRREDDSDEPYMDRLRIVNDHDHDDHDDDDEVEGTRRGESFSIGPQPACHDRDDSHEVGWTRRREENGEDPYLARSRIDISNLDSDLDLDLNSDIDPWLVAVEMAPGDMADGYTVRENSDPIVFVNETEPNVNFSPVMWKEDPSPSSEYSERLASEPSENSQNKLLSDYASDICEEPTDSSACSRFPIGPGHVHHDNEDDGEDPSLRIDIFNFDSVLDDHLNSDIDPSVPVEMAPGDMADGYTVRERLA
ncbi:interferon gamma receptor 1 [Engraulis encrasicolus]|uniref:interferon gamma receptor 1 n=1 Tax=Engraulis encrasicolus TaxID=184585 RepID=UPI002FD31743